MINNNIKKAIIQKRARRATRIVCGGNKDLTWHKTYCHRAYRRRITEQMNRIVNGSLEDDMWDMDPPYSCICTSWDIA
jgi:hypothetical protein